MSAHTASIPLAASSFDIARQRVLIRRAIARGSFATLATASAAQRPHVVAILYQEVDGALYINTLDTSVKARNVRENPRVAVCIPAKRLPLMPPFVVQFQSRAEILTPGDARIQDLVRAGRLKRITSHGELDLPGSCFIRVAPPRRVSSFGLGVPLRTFLRDPLGASRTVDL